MSGVLPMWVADMDFRAPDCVIEALHQEVEFGIFGYALPSPNVRDAILEWCRKRYGWQIEKEWLVFVPGLETALALCSDSVGKRGDHVVCLDPIYPPFYTGPRRMERTAVRVPLISQNGSWSVDWNLLETSLAHPECSLLLFCHPHNPSGKVFIKDELTQLLELCRQHEVSVVSDEVHCDLILDDRPHLPLDSLNQDIEARVMTLMAPNKTFNIAGLGGGFAICSDRKWRQSLEISMKGVSPHPGAMAHRACEAAYRGGHHWRLALLEILKNNLMLLEEFIEKHSQHLSMISPEATYLAWIDCSNMNTSDPSKHFKAHGVGFSPGKIFGSPHHIRMNFACPPESFNEGLKRMAKALEAL